jgi:hypothetical protein
LGSGLYTPQLVVSGRAHVVGSDRRGARAAIEAAAGQATLPVTVSARREGGVAKVTYATGPLGAGDVVLVALTESGLATRVPRGENRGRTLRNDHVVRALVTAPGPRGELSVPLAGAGDGPLSIVVLAQRRTDRAILGAAAAKL